MLLKKFYPRALGMVHVSIASSQNGSVQSKIGFVIIPSRILITSRLIVFAMNYHIERHLYRE